MSESKGAAAHDERFDLRMPAAANAIDIFSGDWTSNLPGIHRGKSAGFFDDPRIAFFESASGGFAGKRILELGPLEGYHTFLLFLKKASEIISIEANTKAYLKCLIVKELYGIDRATFLLGDFMQYLDQRLAFDTIIASGVLYHMTDPLRLIELMCRAAGNVCVWTHYYDEAIIKSRADLKPRFSEPSTVRFKDHPIIVSEQSYPQEALKWGGFCGGAERKTKWLTRESILTAFSALGFDTVIGADEQQHPNGPAIWIVARRR